MKYENMTTGRFISRPNRFISHVRLQSGEEITAHVKNTGRCRELLVPGCQVYLQDHIGDMGKRKLRYSLIGVRKTVPFGHLMINMDSQAPNKVVAEALRDGRFLKVFGDDLAGESFDFTKPFEAMQEKTFGDSRFDFCLKDCYDRTCWMEVKGVTLEDGGIAGFPDAPTQRGVKHVRELIKAAEMGYLSAVVFVIQMAGVAMFRPNWQTHREFGEALRDARAAGVRILAFDCNVTVDSIEIKDKIEVDL